MISTLFFCQCFFFRIVQVNFFIWMGKLQRKIFPYHVGTNEWIWTFLQLKIFKQHYFRPEWWQGKENVFSFLKVRYNSKRKQKKYRQQKFFPFFWCLKKDEIVFIATKKGLPVNKNNNNWLPCAVPEYSPWSSQRPRKLGRYLDLGLYFPVQHTATSYYCYNIN